MELSQGLRRFGLRLGVVALAVIVLQLPIFDLLRFALIVAAALVVFTGAVTTDWRRWLAAVAVTAAVAAAIATWAAPRIDEGYNFYFNYPKATVNLQLPADVGKVLESQFAAEYPAAQQCNDVSFPSLPRFGFSSDAVYQHPKLSRQVAGIDFSDPVHLRLGDINNLVFNGLTDKCDIKRFARDRHSLNLFNRFQLLYPLYLVYEFPRAFAGSELCWRGTVLWPAEGARFMTLGHETMACRTLTDGDVGRSIYALSIQHDKSLQMRLKASAGVEARRALESGLMIAGVLAIVLLLVKVRPGRLYLPGILIALTLVVTTVVDITFIGGLRPLDDRDDGLVYEGYAREMVHHVLAGDIGAALKGVEPVYYFTPGFRYFRTLERFVFGDTYLGYLAVMLAMPLVALALFRRFMSEKWATVLAISFTAIPVGALFGSSLLHYIVWSVRGFADPFAFFLLFAGVLLIVPKTEEIDEPNPLTGYLGALLLAMAAFCRPNLVLAGGAMVFAAALMAVTRQQWTRAAAVCAGFAALAVSPLHNYIYGRSSVLFSDNVNQPTTLMMSPLDYLKAAGEVATLHLSGPHLHGAIRQLSAWLSGPSELVALIPLHAAAIAVLVRIGLFGRGFDPWLRIVALATLLQHGIGISYVNSARYNLGTWLLTALVCAAWLQIEGLGLFDRSWPGLRSRLSDNVAVRTLGRGLTWLDSKRS